MVERLTVNQDVAGSIPAMPVMSTLVQKPMSAMEEQKLAVDIIICSRQTSLGTVRERYNKVRMNYTNTATKIVQSVSGCCELTVSDSSLMAELPRSRKCKNKDGAHELF